MTAFTNVLSGLPYTAVSTAANLSLQSVAYMTDGTAAQALGTNTVGDGGGGAYVFLAAASGFADGVNTLSTPTTGRWVRGTSFSGIYNPALTVSATGFNESFVVVSGASNPITYTLPASTSIVGRFIRIKSIGTGQVTFTGGLSTDAFYDFNTTVRSSSITFNNSGVSYEFLASSGILWRV